MLKPDPASAGAVDRAGIGDVRARAARHATPTRKAILRTAAFPFLQSRP